MARLAPTKSPNLPLSPTAYARQHFDVLNNVLRLYFNRIDAIFEQILGPLGGKVVQFPHISAYDTTDQYATGDNTPTIVKWDTLQAAEGFTLNPPGSATTEQSGFYKIDYSLQFANTNNAVHDVFVWLRVNGDDLAGSASKFTIPARKANNEPSFVVAYSSVTFLINAADVIELVWATDKAYNPTGPVNGVYMEHIDAISSPYDRPSNPSAVGSIVFVSRNGT